MDAELGYRLLTFSCGCTAAMPAINPVSQRRASEIEPFQFGQLRIVDHHSMQRDCDDPDCRGKAGPEPRKTEINRLIRQIKQQFKEHSIVYHKLGQRYHSCLLRTRARLAEAQVCALAHKQFAVSTTPRAQDPFFELDVEAKRLLSEARIGSQTSLDRIVDRAMEMTHRALFLSCLKMEAILTLKFGVDAIAAAERNSAGKAGVTRFENERPLPVKLERFIEKQSSPSSPMPAFLATKDGFVEPTAQNLDRKKPKLQRNADYTWPVHRWTMYKSGGVQKQNTSPITARKLCQRAGTQRHSDREKLFQKMIYGNWIKRVNDGVKDGSEDMYAIWPES